MQLYHSVYHSRRETLSDGDLHDILETSQRNNTRAGLTGALVADDQYFLQVLEGPRDVLTRLLFSIAADPRHSDCQLALFDQAQHRHFDEWSMGLVQINDANRGYLKAAGLPDHIAPEKMSGQMIWDMILTIAGHADGQDPLLQRI